MKNMHNNNQEEIIPFHINLTKSVYDCFMEIVKAENRSPHKVIAQFFVEFLKKNGIRGIADIQNPQVLADLKSNIWKKRFWVFQTEYTERRIDALLEKPIDGGFNLAHLSAIHRFICDGLKEQARKNLSDLPATFLEELLQPIRPGKFRAREPLGKVGTHIHVKLRKLPFLGVESFVAYSPMDSQAVGQLGQVLNKASSFTDTGSFEKFIDIFLETYCWLDYIHPFEEGNSRTLWMFMKNFAAKHGFVVDERPIDPRKYPEKYERFLLLRDLAVNEIDMSIANPDVRVTANIAKIRKLFSGETLRGFFQNEGIICRVEEC